MDATKSVVGKMRSPSLSPLGSEFKGFLFAPVCEDKDEAPLSVISALARLDVDPWEEAAALADLPREVAAQRLASLLAKLPYGPSPTRPDPATISARLVALLPRSATSARPSRGILIHAPPLKVSQLFTLIYLAALLTALVFFMRVLSD